MGKKLVVLDGPMKGLEFTFRRSPLYVGNDFKADVRAPLDESLAPFHFRIVEEEGLFGVEDLGSPGGTLLGGARVNRRASLEPGAVLQAGATRFCFVDAGADRLDVLERASGRARATPEENPACEAGGKPVRVLLVEGDLERAMAAAKALRAVVGTTVTSASSDSEAVAAIDRELPDLLVTVDHMPGIDGGSLVRHLRNRPQGALVPVIAIAVGGESRHAIERTGADDAVLASRLGELEVLSASALRRRARFEQSIREAAAPSPSVPPTGVHGTLESMSLAALLSFLEMEARSGELRLEAGEGTSGSILVREGRAVDARVGPIPSLTGRDAIFAFLRWGSGRFTFLPRTVDTEDHVKSDMTHLLLEGARLDDESRRLP